MIIKWNRKTILHIVLILLLILLIFENYYPKDNYQINNNDLKTKSIIACKDGIIAGIVSGFISGDPTNCITNAATYGIMRPILTYINHIR